MRARSQLQMASYCTRAQASYLNLLVHARGSRNLEHGVVKIEFKEIISFLMDREAKAPKRERRGVDQEVVKKVGVLR